MDQVTTRERRRRRPRSPTIGVGFAAAAGAGAALLLSALERRAVREAWRLDGRVVLITGGSRGLGLALARAFAAEGARLVLAARSADELERARMELLARGAETRTHVCDVRDAADTRRLVEAVVAAWGRLDVLVNNAGVIQMGPFAHATEEDFRDAMETHFWGPLRLIREAQPYLSRAGGRVVNISSVGGRMAVPHLLPYCASKFALAGLSDGLSAELAAEGIRVLTVTPGLMRTGSHRQVRVRGRHEAEARWFGLASATSLTSMRVDRAAAQIVRACREGRARLTPGVQARTALLMQAIAPASVALVERLAARLLPAPGGSADASAARWSRDLDLGWPARLMPARAAAAHNEPVAPDEV